MSIPKLIEHVLEEVSIDGAEGTTIKQLFVYVTEFYSKTLVPKVEINSLCTSPPNSSAPAVFRGEGGLDAGSSAPVREQPAYWGVPNLRDEFQDYVWDILRQQDDFKVGKNSEGNKLSLSDIVADLRNEAGDDNQGDGQETGWRVYTSEERHWRTLTGHGPDLKRVPNAVFKCLEVVAKHREQGLIQPELTKITGQDKKSVAGRTTILKNLGLIEKVSVLARSLNTSKLTLTKFALQRDIKRQAAQESKESAPKKGKKALDSSNDEANFAWTGPTIDTEKLIKAIFLELKGAKNRVLMHSDLKRKLGMDKSRFHWRCFSRILRKLESLGVVRRIRVPLKVLRKYKKTEGPSEIAITEQCHARCVRLIREMEDGDWRKVLTAFSKREFVMEDEDDGEAEGSEDEGAKGSNNNVEEVDPEVAQELGHVNVEEAEEEVVRDPPQWRKDKPLTSTIFDLVDASGKEGISSMDLMYNTIGNFYYRPMDQILHRLTDYPQQSQPPQYMHLAIIRETGISGRQTHYRYFSYRWHQELVADGVAAQPWGPAIKKKGSKQVSHGANSKVTEAAPSLDKYGFAPPNASRFLKAEGDATLAESQWEGKKNERLDSLKAQFRVFRNNAGEEQLDWKNSSRKRLPRNIGELTKGLTFRTARGGRPRKYEKGKEPYLAGKRRAAAKREGTGDLDGEGLGRSLSNEPEGDTSMIKGAGDSTGGPLSKRPRIENFLNSEDQEPPEPPKRRGRPPGVKNGQGKGPAAKKQGKKPTAKTEKIARKSKESQEPQDVQEQDEPQVDTFGPEPELALRRNSRSTKKRKALTETVGTGETKRRKGMDQETNEGDPGENEVITYEAIMVDPASTGPVTNTNTIESTEPGPTASTSVGTEEAHAQHKKAPARVVDGVQLEIEHLDVEGNESYGSIGGMLALSRQQVVLDLLKENSGVFPSGNELRHAYSKRYQKTNPKAGVCDRRLIRGIVQSLQYKKKAYQITFDFISSRGVFITKKLLVDSSLTPDSPLVDAMAREMIAADGNLWFPPNTELHEDIQERFIQPPSWSLSKPRKSEEVEFDRVYPTSVSELKQKREARAIERAANKAARLNVAARPRGRPREYPLDEVFSHRVGGKFTDKQKEEAANRRRAELKAERELLKLNHKYRIQAANLDPYDPSPLFGGLPRSVWWNDFVERHLDEPRDVNPFLQEIYDVEKWEKGVGLQGPESMVQKDEMVMINLFAPLAEKGDNFLQIPVSDMDNRIAAPDFSAPLSGPRKRGPRPRLKNPKPETAKARTADVLMGDQPQKKQRRRPGTYQKPLTRRDRAMAAIRENHLKPSDAEPLEKLPPRKFQFRNQYIIPKEDENTLLTAVIIVRTIFGGWERKIHWELLTKALPQHSVITLQRRWPRVREIHKTHMKKLQAEFEDMFLDAYERRQIPSFDLDNPSSFDLPFYVGWFRENLELPEAQSVPQLPATREAFDDQYDLRIETPKPWRNVYHDPLKTMGHRINHFVCHSYDIPLIDGDGEKGKSRENEDEESMEYIKSVIKANIITNTPDYNPKKAYDILHSYPERIVDATFYNLLVSRTIAHKKRDRLRDTPGTNYEFTDKFHMALKTPMDENLFAQAVAYERYLEESFTKYKAIEVSPLTNDGSMACLFDMAASRKILLARSEHVAGKFGLIDGYKTRAMDKKMVDFKVHIRPGPDFHQKPMPKSAPPIPCGIMDPSSRDPIRLWIGLNGSTVPGMWLKALTAVVTTITSRPGIPNKEISNVLFPSVSLVELDDILAWLAERGCIERKGTGTYTGNWSREGYFLAFKDLECPAS